MRLIVLFIILICGADLYAQTESSKKTLKIKAVDKGNNNTSSIFKLPSKKNTSNFKILKDKKSDNSPIDPKTKFANPGEVYEKKLNLPPTKRGNDKPLEAKFKQNQDLGSFKSNGDFAQFICRDHEYVDGDRVQVLLNGEVIFADILLEGRFKGFKVALKKGFNKIDIVALNQGSSGPNTAEFRVYDDNKNLISSNEWNLTTGVKASLLIVKDE
ncbi:hypothetical protein GTQ40_07495 [Flavobacteriaceae bacterium R38]|nr:hypothetical protein [Flavobacteriaceae bacterium R38]